MSKTRIEAYVQRLRQDTCSLCSYPIWLDAPRHEYKNPITGKTQYRRKEPLAPSVDHILPKSLGGTRDPENIRLTHCYCNSRRGSDKIPWDWRNDVKHRQKIVERCLSIGLISQEDHNKRRLVIQSWRYCQHL